MPKEGSGEIAPRIDVYTLIANHWDIPRHRVKNLICMGAYGMAGSEKSAEEWIKNLDAWDESGRQLAAPAPAQELPKKKGRFSSNIRGILGIAKSR